MRILWLSHLIPYPPKGGVLQRSYNLIKELARYHEITLLAFNQKDLIGSLYHSVEEGIEDAKEQLGAICTDFAFYKIGKDEQSLGTYRLALSSLVGQPYTIKWLKSDDFANAIQQKMRAHAYDLVHFDTISLVQYLSLIPQHMKTCLDHHNIESHMLMRRAQNETNIAKKLYFYQEGLRLKKIEKHYCPKFSLNITCSDIDSQRLGELAPQSRITTIPNGVDTTFFKPAGLTVKNRSLVFAGTMNWYPNVQAVLYIANNLWPALKQKYPDLRIDVIGANPPKSLVRVAESLPDFYLHGFVDDIKPYIETAAVYVCPITDGGGTKLKILDAMAMCKAIVAHPIACEGIEVNDGTNVVLADNDESFISAICGLLDNPERRSALGLEARNLVQGKYDYAFIGKHLSETLQAL